MWPEASKRVTAWPRPAAETAQARRPGGADDGDALLRPGRGQHEFGLVAGARVDQAAGDLAAEGVVEAGLVAADAGVDGLGAAGRGLGDEVGVGEEGAGQRDQVGAAVGEDLLGDLGGVDAVAGDEGYGDRAHQPLGDPGVGAARDGGGDGGDAGLVPADAGVDDRGAGGFDLLGEVDDLVEGGAAGDQVEHREAVDEDEVLADGGAGAADDLQRETHAVLVGTAPAVGALVGGGGDELVDQVALGAHDLDAVVAGELGEAGGADEVLDGALDLDVGQLVRDEGADGGLDGAGGDQVLVVGVAAEVEDLHRDLPALGVHGLGDHPVLGGLLLGGEAGAALEGTARVVGGDAAGDDQTGAAAGALGVEGREALEAARVLFEARVHRAHDHAVRQGGEPEVERAQQVRVRAHGWASPRAGVMNLF